MAAALAASYCGVWAVWLCPAYYGAVTVTRQLDDDSVRRATYGELWDP